jgi:polygalacturonase
MNSIFDVKDFGANGDGTTDDTQWINDAYTFIPSTGGSIIFPPGTYAVTGKSLIIPPYEDRTRRYLLDGGLSS